MTTTMPIGPCLPGKEHLFVRLDARGHELERARCNWCEQPRSDRPAASLQAPEPRPDWMRPEQPFITPETTSQAAIATPPKEDLGVAPRPSAQRRVRPDPVARPSPGVPAVAPKARRGGKQQRWPAEEVAKDIQTLGAGAALKKWIARGMPRGSWGAVKKRAERLIAPPAPGETRGVLTARLKRDSPYVDAGEEAVAEVIRAKIELGFGPMHSAHEAMRSFWRRWTSYGSS